ncbi:hypothetical protein [Paenirhodobacter enshiensis]|uniref:hypothetical protein n=1 Tax=Paenirhodobacter enshiensis TaxID=1105367 RepID=UPI0035B1974C
MTEPAIPGVAAPGKAPSRAQKRHAPKGKKLCPVCGTTPIEEGERCCPACAEKAEMAREGLHVGRNWLLLLVVFGLMLAAGKWVPTLF